MFSKSFRVIFIVFRAVQTSEPVQILRHYQRSYLQGRDLDVTDESVTLDGQTTSLFISRLSILEDSFSELAIAENIRFPLEVNFHGEQAEDLGGPRREFFTIMVKEIQDRMIDEEGNFMASDERIANKHFFFAGILLGIFLRISHSTDYLHFLLL